MEEGIILQEKGKEFGEFEYAETVYGFNNRYGAVCRIAKGGTAPTKVGENPVEDVIELNIIGLTVKPEDLSYLPNNYLKYLYDSISKEDYSKLIDELKKGNNDILMNKFDEKERLFEGLKKEEMISILRTLKEQPEREISRDVPLKLGAIMEVNSRKKIIPQSLGR